VNGEDADGRAAGLLRILEVDVEPADLDGLAARLIALREAGVGGVLLHAEDLAGTLAVLGPALEAAGVRPAPSTTTTAASSASSPADPDADAGRDPAAPTDPPSTLRSRLGLGPAANRFEVPA
jgi:hypothetical protein